MGPPRSFIQHLRIAQGSLETHGNHGCYHLLNGIFAEVADRCHTDLFFLVNNKSASVSTVNFESHEALKEQIRWTTLLGQ
jgi:hypothetical protein